MQPHPFNWVTDRLTGWEGCLVKFLYTLILRWNSDDPRYCVALYPCCAPKASKAIPPKWRAWNVLPFPCPWNWISLSLSLKLKRTTISLSQPPFPLSDSVQFPTLSLSNDFCLEFNLLNTWADKLSNVKSHRYVSWWYLSRKVMNIHLYKRGNVKGVLIRKLYNLECKADGWKKQSQFF